MCATIKALEIMMRRSRGLMVKLDEIELKKLIRGGETNTVELKVAAPRATEMANDRGLVDWEHQLARNATMEDLDLDKVKAYLAQRSANDRQASRFKIFNDTGRRRGGKASVEKTTTDILRRGMPVEGFEPSTPRGDLFLRQARIPFRHTGLWVA
jgi:hypothetical protein